MAKLQKFIELEQKNVFGEYDFFEIFKINFENSELGRVKKLLPLSELAEKLGLKNKQYGKKRGRKSYFSPEGKVALMFLKMYTGLSFPKLMEQLNGNIYYQLFCGVIIDPANPMQNPKVLNDIALDLAERLKIQESQNVLAEAWKPYMENLDTMFTDATCYESEMRFPTDPKLLWEGIEKTYDTMCTMCKALGILRPRTKYLEVEKAYLTYRKTRKRNQKKIVRMTRRLLNLLGKLLANVRKIQRKHVDVDNLLTINKINELDVVTKMYRQQRNHFESGNRKESIKNRIVSLAKPYVRPIVRGKEPKIVEFVAKCNNIMVDGLSFIEKLSFNAFNEGKQLEHCIKMHKRLFGVDVKRMGADTAYAGAENRKICKDKIVTSFVKRGRPNTEEKTQDIERKELARARATKMEGSFGTQKEHYDLRRVKARKKKTEILYIFFGIHTANVVQLAKRVVEREKIALVA